MNINRKELNAAVFGETVTLLVEMKCPDCTAKELKMAFVTDRDRVDVRCKNCGYVAMLNGVERKPNIVGILEATALGYLKFSVDSP
jgi:rubredoxin